MTHKVLIRWRKSADAKLRTKQINFRIDDTTYQKFKLASANKKMTLTEWLIVNSLITMD